MSWVNPVPLNNGDPATLVLANQYWVDNPQFLHDNLGILDAKVAHARLAPGDPVSNFDLDNLPQSYDHLLIMALLRSSHTGATTDGCNIRFNGDAGNNYHYLATVNTAGTITGGQASGTSQIPLDCMSSHASVDGSRFTPMFLTIHRYSEGGAMRAGEFHYNYASAANAGGISKYGHFVWTNIVNGISRITLTAGGGAGFVPGSEVAIFGAQSL